VNIYGKEKTSRKESGTEASGGQASRSKAGTCQVTSSLIYSIFFFDYFVSPLGIGAVRTSDRYRTDQKDRRAPRLGVQTRGLEEGGCFHSTIEARQTDLLIADRSPLVNPHS
jgi:hypothetical protein